jgi:ubiquitin carboxyl-terminal hydrolase 34
MNDFPELKMFNYSPSKESISSYGYLGIKNPSCVCYMLAMLQQFYMTPIFRNAILLADDGIEPNIVDAGRYGNEVDDNILH